MLKNLKTLRKNKKISQQQLADVIGVSQQSINKYENHNVEPDISLLIAIAEYFDTSVDYLVGHTDINRKVENTRKFDLNDEEIMLVEDFRKLTKKQKSSIQLVIENYLSNE